MAGTSMIVDKAKQLPIEPRSQRWAHLSLCVLDAVFSIGARYSTTTRTCHCYADHAGLTTRLVSVTAASKVISTADEQPLHAFLDHIAARGGTKNFA